MYDYFSYHKCLHRRGYLAVHEAAAHFVMDGKHYIYTSGTTSYTPNPSEVAVFDDYHGEYTVLGLSLIHI